MPIHYTPILRWKRGERVGLGHLTAPARQRARPLFLLGTDQFKPKAATKNHAAIPAAGVFLQDVLTAWGAAPFCLDASSLPNAVGQQHPIWAIAASVAAAGANMIPATNLAAPPPYQAAVHTVAQAFNNGVCLRIDLQEAASINAWVGQWPHNVNNTDLVIDFGEEVATVAGLGVVLDNLFLNLHSGPQWRSVTVAGTSMPPNFTGYIAGLHLIQRAEWALWQRLSGLALPYQLNYGDFTSVSPGVTPLNIAWGYPINVKYTLDNSFLICRGVRTKGPNAVDIGPQLEGHAISIRNYPNRHALPQIWADPIIDLIATGGAEPQGLEHWVQLSVNRHIELMHVILP